MGKGSIALKGARQRPWFELSRSELERSYLDHQSRILRKYHDGPVDVVWDRIATNGFYDKERIRLRGEGLWRAYELLCPRDKREISPAVLDIVGLNGLTALWMDQGRFLGRRGQIKGRYSDQEYEEIAKWIRSFGIKATVHRNHLCAIEIIIGREPIQDFVSLIRPYTHVSMKKKLRPRKS